MRETAAYKTPSVTLTEALMPSPSPGSLVDHTGAPVSAFAANTQPAFEPMNMQPSAITGVPVKSPVPPALAAEKTNAGFNVVALIGVMVFSSGWLRVLL